MKDRFSQHAKQYAAFRPTYPRELYEFILQHVSSKNVAWDCGCGNGQVANDLLPHFQKVFATDISAKQLENAVQNSKIEYSISKAEHTEFKNDTFDLITVGQALHWFDIDAFFKEVKRVAKPGGVVAVWGYSLLVVDVEIDKHISDFYLNIVGPYWDKERKLVDERYTTIPFPFTEISAPSFKFSFEWSLDQLHGYLTTWSAVQKYIATNGLNPVDELMGKIKSRWGEGNRTVTFPLFLRLGVVMKS